MTVLGAHAIASTRLDVWVMFIFGIISFISRTLNFHPAPIVLGLIDRAVFSVLTINRYSPNWSTSPSAIR
ncbi:hypothetical protein [Desulfosediminicola sp.]|uniref:hypothetical protein n=1 Tax=Desulfosediminicola sp. TaxID=2886825 RepID=UPI003AF30390